MSLFLFKSVIFRAFLVIERLCFPCLSKVVVFDRQGVRIPAEYDVKMEGAISPSNSEVKWLCGDLFATLGS